MNIDTDIFLATLSVTAGLIGVFFQVRANHQANQKQLLSEHDWNRRKYALDMIGDWNNQMEPIKSDIQKVCPGILEGVSSIQRELAIEIINSREESSSVYFDAKVSIDALLNYFEFISMSYTESVADRNIIEATFMPVMLMWDRALKEYRVAHKDVNGEDRWLPYTQLIERWIVIDKGKKILESQEKARKAQKDLDDNQRLGTGI